MNGLQLIGADHLFCIGDQVYPKRLLSKLFRNSKHYKKTIFKIFESFASIDCEVLDFFLQKRITDLEICRLNEMGHTIIHLAFYNGYLDRIELLFERCIKTPHDIVDENGISHLHIACIVGSLKKVDQLLRHKAALELPYRNERFVFCTKFRPLHLAITSFRFEVAECLLQHKADVRSQDSLGRTALHLAASTYPNHSCCIDNSISFSPLASWQLSMDEEDAEVVRFLRLLLDFGSDINALDEKGNPPLFHIFDSYYLWCELSNDDTTQAKRGRKEIKSRQKQKLQFLLDRGADFRIRNSRGSTVLHAAVEDIKNSTRTFVEDSCEMIVSMIDILLDAGADVNAKDNDGLIPLQAAVTVLSADAVSVLLKHNADLSDVLIDKFDYFYENCLPCYKTVENLLRILNLLTDRGFVLDSAAKLAVMRFLIFNIDDTEADEFKLISDYEQVKNVIEYGSTAMLRRLFRELKRNGIDEKYYGCTSLQFMEKSNIYMDAELRSEVKELFDLNIFKPVSLEQVDKDVNSLKSIQLKNGKSLYDLLTTNPDYIYLYANSNECKEILMADDFNEKFENHAGLIKGHFTKSLIRRIFLTFAMEFLVSILGSKLPCLVFEKICTYMTNEELWFMCSNGLARLLVLDD